MPANLRTKLITSTVLSRLFDFVCLHERRVMASRVVTTRRCFRARGCLRPAVRPSLLPMNPPCDSVTCGAACLSVVTRPLASRCIADYTSSFRASTLVHGGMLSTDSTCSTTGAQVHARACVWYASPLVCMLGLGRSFCAVQPQDSRRADVVVGLRYLVSMGMIGYILKGRCGGAVQRLLRSSSSISTFKLPWFEYQQGRTFTFEATHTSGVLGLHKDDNQIVSNGYGSAAASRHVGVPDTSAGSQHAAREIPCCRTV